MMCGANGFERLVVGLWADSETFEEVVLEIQARNAQ